MTIYSNFSCFMETKNRRIKRIFYIIFGIFDFYLFTALISNLSARPYSPSHHAYSCITSCDRVPVTYVLQSVNRHKMFLNLKGFIQINVFLYLSTIMLMKFSGYVSKYFSKMIFTVFDCTSQICCLYVMKLLFYGIV